MMKTATRSTLVRRGWPPAQAVARLRYIQLEIAQQLRRQRAPAQHVQRCPEKKGGKWQQARAPAFERGDALDDGAGRERLPVGDEEDLARRAWMIDAESDQVRQNAQRD